VSVVKQFFAEVSANIESLRADRDLHELSRVWLQEAARHRYSYNFTWMGRPIIQLPQDIVAMQEIIWRVQPDLIVETGIAHGGSLVFYASMLHLIGGDGLVVGIDIDIREHNRREIEKHPMYGRIRLIEGSSIDPRVVQEVERLARSREKVLVCLDSDHTHEHVLCELELYSPLVTRGSYLVVFDTVIEDMPKGSFPNRPWGRGNSPKTAVWEFLKTNDRFVIDEQIQAKLQITSAPEGYLRCIKE
jgi:cephalosporin hydroxylase